MSMSEKIIKNSKLYVYSTHGVLKKATIDPKMA